MTAKKTNIIVVGGGILGCAIAHALVLRGSEVTQVVGSPESASDGSLVWLNVTSTETPDYARLRAASMDLWHQLIAADETCPVAIRGTLLWDRDEEALEALAAFQASVGWQTEVIGADRFARLAPGIAAPPKAALYAPGEATADPADLMQWAGARALAAGVKRLDADVATVNQGEVALMSGQRLAADHVVIAAGAGSPALLAPLGLDPKLRDAPGMLLRTEPLPHQTGPVLASPGMDFWQGADGTIYVATGTHRTMVDDLEGSAASALETLATLMPGCAGAKTATLALRQRPIPGDGFPVVGQVPNAPGVWVAVTHSGMTLAPIIAQALGEWLVDGQPDPLLQPFSPKRLMEEGAPV